MKLKEYIKKLQVIERKHGGNLEVVYSKDDEGNEFRTVNFTPSAGHFINRSYYADDGTEEFAKNKTINSVCIN